MSKNQTEPSIKGGLTALIIIVIIIIIIYKGCFSNSKYADSGMVVDTAFNDEVPVSKVGALTESDSRIDIFSGRNEYPKEDDLVFAIKFYMQDIVGMSADILYDDITLTYIEDTKVYRNTGIIRYINSRGKKVTRKFQLGLNYIGGFPLKKDSWKVVSFKWI